MVTVFPWYWMPVADLIMGIAICWPGPVASVDSRLMAAAVSEKIVHRLPLSFPRSSVRGACYNAYSSAPNASLLSPGGSIVLPSRLVCAQAERSVHFVLPRMGGMGLFSLDCHRSLIAITRPDPPIQVVFRRSCH